MNPPLPSGKTGSDRCPTCGVSKQQVLQHTNKQVADLMDRLQAMTEARDLCKRQTAELEELRQWQVQHAQVAFQAIEVHGQSGVWASEDCATQASAALERMSSPVGSKSEGMQEPTDA